MCAQQEERSAEAHKLPTELMWRPCAMLLRLTTNLQPLQLLAMASRDGTHASIIPEQEAHACWACDHQTTHN
jgi:hypothetical protein